MTTLRESNGNIGMMGGSYRGMVQWMTLKNKPAALKTIVPTAAVGPGIDFPIPSGTDSLRPGSCCLHLQGKSLLHLWYHQPKKINITYAPIEINLQQSWHTTGIMTSVWVSTFAKAMVDVFSLHHK